VPQDKGNAVYLTCLLYGIGVLMPFNVIMACLDFYDVVVSIHGDLETYLSYFLPLDA